jgi:outer membrane lipoprotein
MVKAKQIAIVAVLLIFNSLIQSCASGITSTTRNQVSYQGPFSVLKNNPEPFIGQTALLGGKVLEVKATPHSSELVILQVPLGAGDRPQNVDQSEGRFLVRSEKFLDPAIYKKDVNVTILGQIVGRELRPISGFNYPYPVLQAQEIKIWSPEQRFPIIFGIGIGTRIY